MEQSQKYKIRVFGYGYEGSIILSLIGEVDADRINDEVIHLCVASPERLNFKKESFYDTSKVRVTYEEVVWIINNS